MYRLMQPADLPAMKALWQQAFGDSADYAESAILQFAGQKHAFVAEQQGQLLAMALAPTAHIGGRRGAYICGLAVAPADRGQGVGTGLLAWLCQRLAESEAEFVALVPAEKSLFAWYEKRGFAPAFAVRRVARAIKRNIWSQAEFDAAPAKRLSALRVQYCPQVVQLGDGAMVHELTDLYSRGITVVNTDAGYGLYFRQGDTLHFVELMAEGDRAAERLLEAAREKEVIVDKAELVVNAGQNLFLGEGSCEPHGMIRFFGQPFDVSESYLGLAMDR